MRPFLRRLQQSKLVQWALAYIAAAFALLQGADVIAQQFGWPDAIRRAITLLLAGGLCVTLVLAWYHGERGTQRVTSRELLILAALLAVGGALLWRFAPAPPAVKSARPGAPTSAAPVTYAPVPSKSIAVLPFADLSPGHDQEYFSDGIAEEILNALTHIRDLKVAGRTSSFQFKGRNEDSRGIGSALAVAHLLEGSVRKQGDKVRITAQLIRAEDGYDVWSDTYDGELADVFELQERIARAITGKLEVILQGDQQKRLIPVATGSPEAYALYLQASSIFNRREGARWSDAIRQLEQALRLDPKYARAHSRLAAIALLAPQYAPFDWDASRALVEEHARKAIELDATLAEPHAVLGQADFNQRRFLESRPEFERALALDPDDATAGLWHAIDLILSGYRNQGDKVLDRLLEVDPMLPNALLQRGLSYAYDGDDVNAERLLQRAADAKLAFAGVGLSLIAEARHQEAEAIEQLADGLKGLRTGLPEQSNELLARGILGDEQARRTALAMIDDHLKTNPMLPSRIVAYGLMRMHEPARALALAQEQPARNDIGFLWILWSPYGREVRAQPEFPEFVRKIGLAAVWDQYGEPDYCRRRAPGDYVCE